MSSTHAAAFQDIDLGISIQVFPYARINPMLIRDPDDWFFFQEGALGFVPGAVQELPNEQDPGMALLLVYGAAAVADFDPDTAGLVARLARAGAGLHSDIYCRVLLRAPAGEPTHSRIAEMLAEARAQVCAPVMTYGTIREYPVAPCGERGPVVFKPAMVAARLLEVIERLGCDWTRTGAERRGMDVPAVCIESLPAGFRGARDMSISGLGIEVRL